MGDRAKPPPPQRIARDLFAARVEIDRQTQGAGVKDREDPDPFHEAADLGIVARKVGQQGNETDDHEQAPNQQKQGVGQNGCQKRCEHWIKPMSPT